MADDSRNRQATLGCGTLILIGVIVLIFSRPGVEDLESEVRGLHSEVEELKKMIEAQTAQFRVLQDKVEARE